MSSGYGLFKIHALFQCEDSSTFKDVFGGVEKSDVSRGYISMNRYTDLQKNVLESFFNDNYSNDTYINDTLQNIDVSSGIGLLNGHTIPQDNESSNFNEMNMSVDNGDVNGAYCYINSSTIY